MSLDLPCRRRYRGDPVDMVLVGLLLWHLKEVIRRDQKIGREIGIGF
jgi:hypothetical protein